MTANPFGDALLRLLALDGDDLQGLVAASITTQQSARTASRAEAAIASSVASEAANIPSVYGVW